LENGNGTDLYGFLGLPGGGRQFDGSFVLIGNIGIWWILTEINGDYMWDRGLYWNNPGVNKGNFIKYYGFSVRCLRDDQMDGSFVICS
jgi:uncharacterized protein (TIGR02145 family)